MRHVRICLVSKIYLQRHVCGIDNPIFADPDFLIDLLLGVPVCKNVGGRNDLDDESGTPSIARRVMTF